MAEKGVIFPRPHAERVWRATRAYEQQPVNLVGPRPQFRAPIPAYVIFRVNLTQIAGSIGSLVAHPSWTYDVYWPWDDESEVKLNGTPLTPEKGRAVYGRHLAASHGLAYYDKSGTLVLYEADESPSQTQGCS